MPCADRFPGRLEIILVREKLCEFPKLNPNRSSSSASFPLSRRHIFERYFFRRLNDFVQKLHEFFESCGRDDDGIVPPGNVLRDTEQSPARILFERKNEVFTLNLYLTRFKRIFPHRRLRLPV